MPIHVFKANEKQMSIFIVL